MHMLIRHKVADFDKAGAMQPQRACKRPRPWLISVSLAASTDMKQAEQ